MKKLWKCTVCGYVHEGDNAAEICPKCGAPREKFVELGMEDTEKIYKSDHTNDIHMELVNLSMRMSALCEEGISLKLDPACVATFEKAKAQAWIIKQMCKAEMAGHMSKGKW